MESNGEIVPVVWRLFADDGEALPLYAAGVMELFRLERAQPAP